MKRGCMGPFDLFLYIVAVAAGVAIVGLVSMAVIACVVVALKLWESRLDSLERRVREAERDIEYRE
jgi:DNA-binding IclR family transcriptional regulator